MPLNKLLTVLSVQQLLKIRLTKQILNRLQFYLTSNVYLFSSGKLICHYEEAPCNDLCAWLICFITCAFKSLKSVTGKYILILLDQELDVSPMLSFISSFWTVKNCNQRILLILHRTTWWLLQIDSASYKRAILKLQLNDKMTYVYIRYWSTYWGF